MTNYNSFKDYPALVRIGYQANDADLVAKLRIRLEAGDDPDATSPYGETAVKQVFRRNNIDALRLLVNYGAALDEFKWTPLHCAVVLGSFNDVQALAQGSDLAIEDVAFRSPYLLACRVGAQKKAALLRPLTPENGFVCPNDKETALHLAAEGGHIGVLEWLVAQGDDVNARDEFGGTALLLAVEYAHRSAVEYLLNAGANPALGSNISASLRKMKMQKRGAFSKATNIFSQSSDSDLGLDAQEDTIETPATSAFNVEIVRLLVKAGVSPEHFDSENIRQLTGADKIPPQEITPEMFTAQYARIFGTINPQPCDTPFHIEQIRGGRDAYTAGAHIMGKGHSTTADKPIWSFARFGRTTTQLPDGRWVLIAGEHEDYYDDDFCIYSDVTVLDGKGGVEHFIYPRGDFPPTDFHTATLLGDRILLIGNLGYPEDRKENHTQVLQLSLDDFSISRVDTSGDNPGWIHGHTAQHDGDKIIISGGKVEPGYSDLVGRYALDLKTMVWQRLS